MKNITNGLYTRYTFFYTQQNIHIRYKPFLHTAKRMKTLKNGTGKVKTGGNKPKIKNGGSESQVIVPEPGSHPVYEAMTLGKKAILIGKW